MSTFYQLRHQKGQDDEGWMKDWEDNTIPPDMLLKDMMTRIRWFLEQEKTPMLEATLLAADMFERKELLHRALQNLVKDGRVVRREDPKKNENAPQPAPRPQPPQLQASQATQASPAPPAPQPSQAPPPQRRNHGHPLYKTVPCRHFNTKEGCSWGDECNYAHGDDLRHDRHEQKRQERAEMRRKNGKCPYVESNLFCPQGPYKCPYMH